MPRMRYRIAPIRRPPMARLRAANLPPEKPGRYASQATSRKNIIRATRSPAHLLRRASRRRARRLHRRPPNPPLPLRRRTAMDQRAPQAARNRRRRRLPERLAKWFIKQKARRICVDVDPANAPARRFYTKHGAQTLNAHWLVWPDIKIALTKPAPRKKTLGSLRCHTRRSKTTRKATTRSFA